MATITAAEAGYTYGAAVTLEVLQCPTCGITYGVPERLIDYARERTRAAPGETIHWFCPNGHQLSFPGENREQKLERQRDEARNAAARARAQRDQAEASAKAHRGAATRARNERDRIAKRAAAGVCPCCNRTFKQLARHMKSQHPDFEGGS